MGGFNSGEKLMEQFVRERDDNGDIINPSYYSKVCEEMDNKQKYYGTVCKAIVKHHKWVTPEGKWISLKHFNISRLGAIARSIAYTKNYKVSKTSFDANIAVFILNNYINARKKQAK